MKESTRGSMFLLCTALIAGLTPVVVHKGSVVFPPVLFLMISICTASAFLLILLLITGRLFVQVTWRAFRNVFGVAVFIIGGFALLHIGSQHSNAINTGILWQVEVVWTFLFSALILRDRITPRSLAGASIILLGSLVVLWRGVFSVNGWELLMVASTALFPFGNACAKRALEELPPIVVILLRYLLGALLLLPLSILLGEWTSTNLALNREQILLILSNAVLILVVSKICWYEGLRRHTLHFSVAAITGTPALALLFAFVVLGEIPTVFQWLGFGLTMMGLWVLFRPHELGEVVDM